MIQDGEFWFIWCAGFQKIHTCASSYTSVGKRRLRWYLVSSLCLLTGHTTFIITVAYISFFLCVCLSLEQVNIIPIDDFWVTFGTHLYLDAPEYIEEDAIKSSNDFDKMFHKKKGKSFVIFIDEDDKLFKTDDDVSVSFLSAICTRLQIHFWSGCHWRYLRANKRVC